MDVLHYMTGRGVAHRDHKCDNIIINPDTLALKIIDFGLGTEICGEDARDSTYRGTPVYMAPGTFLPFGPNRSLSFLFVGINVILF